MADSIFEFREFRLDIGRCELLRHGHSVRLERKPLELLILLATSNGRLVSRDEIAGRLWEDGVFVDTEHGINTAVRKIRASLHDNPDNPRFIQTVPGQGYRFLAPVSTAETASPTPPEAPFLPSGELEGPVQPDVPVLMVRPDYGSHSRRWFTIAAGVLAILVVSAALVVHRSPQQQSPAEQAAQTALPFTALPGRATSPAFSPDGDRIAFAWNGDPKGPAKGFDLYVKALGGETLLRLTEHPSEWVSPAWSPDGTQIAFYRMDGADTGIYTVSPLGGSERKLRSTHILASDYATVSWSPDGQWLAFTELAPTEEHTRINLLSMKTLEAKQLPGNAECIREGLPAFSHSGEYLAYWCLRRPFDAVLYIRPVRGGLSKAVSSFRAFPNGLTWSADDTKLVYSLYSLGRGLYKELGQIDVESGSTKQLELARSAQQPAIFPRGDKLAYVSLSVRFGLWRRDLIHPETPSVEVIPSSRTQFAAQYSPEGGRIAFASLRTGMQGVWISKGDGTDLVQITDPNYVSGSPQWSPDGSKIVFDSHPGERWEIYEADVAERKPRKLVTNLTNVVRPHWSHDGKWIYFSSQESGKMGIYRCPASGGHAVPLSQGAEEINARESLDGKFVYFASDYEKSTLKQVALPPQFGAESKIKGLPRIHLAELWTLSRSGIYFVPADAPRSLRYFDFGNKQVRPVFEVDRDFGNGLSVSPDGHWIMYSLAGEESSDIMLVNHFH